MNLMVVLLLIRIGLIHIILDEDDHTYTFDVFDSNGNCICESMCLINQAHDVAVRGKR